MHSIYYNFYLNKWYVIAWFKDRRHTFFVHILYLYSLFICATQLSKSYKGKNKAIRNFDDKYNVDQKINPSTVLHDYLSDKPDAKNQTPCNFMNSNIVQVISN